MKNLFLIGFLIISLFLGLVFAAPPKEGAYVVIEPELVETSPKFINYPSIKKSPTRGEVLTDIEEHMDYRYAAGDYHDPDAATQGHESSHGISSVLRQKFTKRGKINAFYVLKNKAIILQEPPTTIKKVAPLVPRSLRGMSYNLYLVQQAESWNDESLYILDEFNAYTNGTAVGLNLNLNRGESCQQMLDFVVYSVCLAGAIENSKQDGNTYDDQEFKQFLMWQIERAISYCEKAKNTNMSSPSHEQYLNKFRTASDASSLRKFAKNYFGEKWTAKFLGF